jgi:hypothetical protein
MQCPHCKLVGFIILHGYLYGFSEKEFNKKIKRGRRFFCSNRNKRDGCGRTFSLLIANIIKGFVYTAETIWAFLNSIFNGINKSRAFNSLNVINSTATIYRIYNRFKLSQTHIRSLLSVISKPPDTTSNNPVFQTILHLKETFKDKDCPITAFQLNFQTSIF